jgi:quercetin dioxygenase-like cupin family protein
LASRLTAEHRRFRRPTRAWALSRFREEGLEAYHWSNPPALIYEPHSHPFRDIIRCVAGSITFHTSDGDFELTPGSRFEMDPDTEHSATVGRDGVGCVETSARDTRPG